MKSKKLLVLGLSAVALFSTVGVSLAYWASGISSASQSVNPTLTVGAGDSYTATVTLTTVSTTTGSLVPAAYVESGKVATIEFKYTVKWNATTTGVGNISGATTALSFSSTLVSVVKNSTDNKATVGSLLHISNPSTVAAAALNTDYNVTWAVTMDEPADLAAYNLIAGATVTYTLTASAAAVA